MNQIVEPISRWQYFWMVAISTVAGGIYLWPQYLVQHMGPNGVFALLTSVGLATALLMLQVALAHRLNQATVLSGIRRLLPVLGIGLIFPISAITCLFTDLLLLVLYGQMMHNFFYPLTPIVVIDGLIAASAGWVAFRTLSAVARSVQFWFPIILLLTLVVVTFSIPNMTHLAALLPSSDFTLRPWVQGTISTWFLFSNSSVVITLTPHVRWTHPRQAYTTVAAAMAMQASVLLIFYVVCLTTLGAPAVSRLWWPVIYVFSLISAQAFFFKGIGVFVLITWTSAIVLYLAVHLFCLSFNLFDQMAEPATMLTRVSLVFGLVAALTLGTLFVPSELMARALVFHWVNPLSFSWAAISDPGLWLIARYRRARMVAR